MKKLWINKEYKLDSTVIISDLIINKYINLFWDEIMSQLDVKQYVLLLFRVKFNNGNYSTISELQKINIKSKDDLIKTLINKLNISFNAYKDIPITYIVISYGIRKGKVTIKDSNNIDIPKVKYHSYYNNKLPIAITPESYGKIVSQSGNTYFILADNATIILEQNGNINNIKYIKDYKVLFNWTDEIISKEDNKFIRKIGKSNYHYENNDLNLYTVTKKTKAMKPKIIAKGIKQNRNFITMDIETILINNIQVPYLLCWFDGEKSKSYFINSLDSNNLENNILDMIKKAIKDLNKNYNNYSVYLHNFSKFDAYFLIKHLSKIGLIEPIIHKGRIISLDYMNKKNSNALDFKDSYLMLPSSLRNLCNSFSVESPKGIFPFLLHDINYEGEVPDFKYFNNISLDEYNKYKDLFINKTWSFKNEAIKYCELDCISLFQVLTKFNKLIFNKFKLNITKYPTLPSLSFNLFKTHYLTKDSIHMLSGKIAKDIREGYTGGAVDMYIPKSPSNKFIYAYDANSLYPYVMSEFKMPIGSPTYFQRDIRKINPKAFGFFYCKITAPLDLKHPILQTHVKTNDGIRTVAPLGTWEGMYFSEELYNAEKFGYKFDILWGYTFESLNVFNSFINNLYQLRLEYPKSDPMNYIAKILMNSAYGRFGMDDNFTYIEIWEKDEYKKLEKDNIDNIINITELGDNYLVELKFKQSELDTSLDNASETHNVNIAIASAVTAYARIHMSQFKNNPNLPNLYYSDTDSVYFDGPLPENLVNSKKLGALKLEGIYNKAIFLAPKVYALLDQNQNLEIKIKGVTKKAILDNNININLFEGLLYKNHLYEIKQDKWFKSLTDANIKINEQLYSLKVTNNKRFLINYK